MLKKYLIYIDQSNEFAWLDSNNNLKTANIDRQGKNDAIIRFGEFDYDICFAAFKFAGKMIPRIKHINNRKFLNSVVQRQCYQIGDYYLYANKRIEKTELYWY